MNAYDIILRPVITEQSMESVADKKNVFDVERYMKRRPAIVKPDEPFDMYELNASDLEPDNNNSTKRKEK